jgi:two-component system chemotaxis response regulator CheY
MQLPGNIMANILLVDDSVSMREMVSFTLKQAGHDVIEAEDGIQALDIAQGKLFSLVITDVNMPKMDGIVLTDKLRQIDSCKFTPILILTTDTSEFRKLEGKAAGATGWIEKPFDPDQLISTVNKVL